MKAKLLILAASCTFGLMALFVKLCSVTLTGGQITLIRSVASTGLLGLLMATRIIPFQPANTRLLWWRGTFGGLAALCYFSALQTTSVGKAAILNNTSPLFVALFSSIFLRESLHLKGWWALVIAFLGVFLVINPSVEAMVWGDLLGLLSGALAGGAYLSMRALRKTDSVWVIFLAFSIGGLLVSLPFIVMPWPALTGWILLWILGMLITSWIAQLLLTYALKFISAAEGGILGLSTGVFATMWSLIFFQDPLTWHFLTGTLLVLTGCGWILRQHPLPAKLQLD